MKEDLLQLGLSEEKGEWVATQWKTNFQAMSRVAAGQSLTVNQLVDMEWRFGGKKRSHPLLEMTTDRTSYIVTFPMKT